MQPLPNQAIAYQPVTAANLAHLQGFAQCYGKWGYCSCMRWRMTSSQFQKSSKEDRALAMQEIISQGVPVGLLAYDAGFPVGWCSIAPRSTYGGLERYKALPRLDQEAVWSVVCFFLAPPYRRQGMKQGLLAAARDYALHQGAEIVEGYPVEPGAPSYGYMGHPQDYLDAGFRDVTPKGQTRRVFRYVAADPLPIPTPE